MANNSQGENFGFFEIFYKIPKLLSFFDRVKIEFLFCGNITLRMYAKGNLLWIKQKSAPLKSMPLRQD